MCYEKICHGVHAVYSFSNVDAGHNQLEEAALKGDLFGG